MRNLSAKEFAEFHHVDYLSANAFLRLLEQTGHVQFFEIRKSVTGKGKGTKVYSVPNDICLDLTKPLVAE